MSLAPPLSQIFNDLADATVAFELLHQTARQLNLEGAYDSRLALTLSRTSLHLDYGGWLVLGFRRPERVSIALLSGKVDLDSQFKISTFATGPDEPTVHSYDLPMSMVKPLSAELQAAYDQTLIFIAEKFEHWRNTPYLRHHKPELAEALFNIDKRTRLFDEGLPEADLTYERHLTPFNHAVGEEPSSYQITNDLAVAPTQPPESSMTPQQPIYSLPQLVADSYLDEAVIKQWLRALKRKKQAILYGPPGTGKTYLAKRLAQQLVSGGNGLIDLIQFHPAYSYEDFMQGLRPRLQTAGHLSYDLVAGRFVDFCRHAAGRDRSVLIIDEINRANLSTVFGELMYLLEYRQHTIKLASGESFHLPDNVYLIGTMNTADRSIALVDYALRRRFAFLQLRPQYEVLSRYHAQQQTGFEPSGLITVLKRINQQIGDWQYEIGPAFFLQTDLQTDLADIWQTEIEPYLEEFFFNNLDSVTQFRWSAVETILMGR